MLPDCLRELVQLHLVQLDQTKDLINRDRICIRHLQGGVRREGLLLDHRQERSPPRRSGLGLPATMPIISTPCPAARRGVGRTASSTRTSTRSGTTPPCRPSGARAAASRIRAPTLTQPWFVCVCAAAHRPASSRFRQMPAASCPLPAASSPVQPALLPSLSSGCAATVPFRCPVLSGAGAAARGDRR